MLKNLKKNYFLLISTFLILYFFFNFMSGDRGLVSYLEKKKTNKNLQIKEKMLINNINELDFKNSFERLCELYSFCINKSRKLKKNIIFEIGTEEQNGTTNTPIELKKTLAFLVIENNAEELIFKKYNSDKKFRLGKFKIPEPIVGNKQITPQLFFVPCLGFDLDGYRIGYGGGYYDKTFAKLKKLNLIFYAVGFVFDKQKQNKLPIEKFDYKLDFVLTEKQLYTFS